MLLPGYRLHGLPLSISRSLKGLPYTNGFANRYTNGHTNGHTNGIVNGNGHGVIANGNYSTNWLHAPKRVQSEQAGTREFVLIPFSAHDDQALAANVASLSGRLDDFNLANLLYTLGARKSSFPRRAFVVKEAHRLGDGLDIKSMTTAKTTTSPIQRIGFVFTGQGAQWPEMGSKLMDEYASFRQTIRYLDDVLGCLSMRPSWTIEGALCEPAATSRIHDPAFSQTVCTALQIGLVSLLRQWEIEPAVTVGHSSGKF